MSMLSMLFGGDSAQARTPTLHLRGTGNFAFEVVLNVLCPEGLEREYRKQTLDGPDCIIEVHLVPSDYDNFPPIKFSDRNAR